MPRPRLIQCSCGHTHFENGGCPSGCICRETTDPCLDILEIAFYVQDPCGEPQLRLATAMLALIADRSDADCVALCSEIRALALKYPRKERPKPASA